MSLPATSIGFDHAKGADAAERQVLQLTSPSIVRRVRDLPRSLGWCAVGLLLVPWLLAVVGSMSGGGLAALTTLGFMGALVATPLGFGLANRGGQGGALVVDDHGVQMTVAGYTSHAGAQMVQSAVIIPSSRGCRVELRLKDDTTLAIELPEIAQGEALIARLWSGSRAASMTIGTQTPTPLWAALAMLGGWLIQGMLLGFSPTIWPPLAALAAVVVLAPTNIIVGDDGIRLRRGWRRKFIAFDSIKSMQQVADGRLYITLADGRRLRIGSRAAGHAYAKALLQRIQSAMSPEGGATAAATQLLTRGDRSLVDWRAALRGLFHREPGYRGPRLTRRDALAVLFDTTRAADQRLGAAMALSAVDALDDDTRSRIRIAAEASANPKLRIALEGVADAALDQTAVDEAIEAVTAEPQAAARVAAPSS